jgi:hypothetical protein
MTSYTITTIYRAPTARYGARMEARIDDGAPTKMVIAYRHDLSPTDNHAAAAIAMAERLDDPSEYAGGQTIPGVWAWVPLVVAVTPLVNVTAGRCYLGKTTREWKTA